MAADDKRKSKSGGGKLSRSETVTVRLDPKLRYLAELAARKQRRTLSSFVEWAIEDALGRVNLYEGDDYSGDHSRSVGEEAAQLWDVDEADRFAKLAFHYPDLLTHEEQVLWKLIRENGALWLGDWGKKPDYIFKWQIKEDYFQFDKLREHWDIFNKAARGECQKSDLPSWVKAPPETEKIARAYGL